jgi:hypothetical protein
MNRGRSFRYPHNITPSFKFIISFDAKVLWTITWSVQKNQIEITKRPIKTPGQGRSLLTPRTIDHASSGGTEHVLLLNKSSVDIEYPYFRFISENPPISLNPIIIT